MYLFLLGMIIYGRRIILWIVLFAFSLMSLFGFARLVQPVLSILFMDVGQGAGTLIQADGYTGLVDTGDGKTDLVDVLWAQGITDLDFIVLTHGHQDHIGGLEMILNTYKPRVLYTSQNTEVGLQEVRDLAIRHGIEVCSVSHQNQVKLGSVTMEFLISEASFNQSDESAENNSSLNVRLVCVYGSAIICGDLEEKGIEQLLQMNAFPQSDVLFVPHHGSNSGTSEKMLSNILPKYAIISVGIRNSYGHPGAVTLSNLERIGALVYRTDVVGGISVSFGDTHWFRKRYVEVWQTLS